VPFTGHGFHPCCCCECTVQRWRTFLKNTANTHQHANSQHTKRNLPCQQRKRQDAMKSALVTRRRFTRTVVRRNSMKVRAQDRGYINHSKVVGLVSWLLALCCLFLVLFFCFGFGSGCFFWFSFFFFGFFLFFWLRFERLIQMLLGCFLVFFLREWLFSFSSSCSLWRVFAR